MHPDDLNLATLATLLGPALTRLVLDRVAAAGFDGVKPSHGYVIQRLVDDEPTIGALAASLRMTQQGASKQVSDLEGLGYVERVADGRDQRLRTVRLTKRGRSLLAAGRRIQADLEADVTDRVGPRNVRAAKKALVALLEITDLAQHIPTRTVPLGDVRR